MRSFIVLGILLLMLPVASGFEDFLEVVVEIDASGNAFVSYFPSIDSRLRTELNMSVPGGSYFKVYDENSSLSFTSEDDWLVVSPSKHVESYLFVVEFFTSELTEKKEDFWFARFSYFDGFDWRGSS